MNILKMLFEVLSPSKYSAVFPAELEFIVSACFLVLVYDLKMDIDRIEMTTE